MLRPWFILLSVLLARPAQPQDVDTDARALAENLAKAHKVWNAALNTPGAALRLQEVERGHTRNSTTLTYYLFADGLPRDKIYSIVSLELNETTPEEYLTGVTLNNKGMAVCAGRPGTCKKPEGPNVEVTIDVSAAKGEAKRFALVAADGQAKAFLAVVPFPIRAKDHGCSLEILRLLRDSEAILVRGSGFPPNAAIAAESDSEGEKLSAAGQSDVQGGYDQVLLPYVKGKKSGKVRVTFRASGCSPSASISWGKNTYFPE
jgi:hypothetical protein